MEVDRKRPNEGPVPGAKRPSIDASGPVSAEEIELFQKEAIFRQMNAYRRERDELKSQLEASASGDEALREELAQITEKYVAAAKQVERLASPSLARLMNTGKNDEPSSNGSDGNASSNGYNSGNGSPKDQEPTDSKTVLELQSNLAAAEAEIKKLREFMETEDKKRAELEHTIRQLEEQIAQSPVNSNSFEIRFKEARAEIQRLVIETQNLQQQIADLKGDQAEYEQQVRERSSTTVQSLERRISAAESDVVRIRSARDELLSEVNILKAECAEHKNEASRLKETLELNDNAKSTSESTKETQSGESVSESTLNPGDLPSDVDTLRERYLSLMRQNKALTEEISGLEQGFVRATTKAKAALKTTSVIEQKLGVLNTAKVRSDEKFIGAMRGRDALSQELARTKQALSKSAEVVSDQKSLEQKLTAQISRLQRQVAQAEVANKQRQVEVHNIQREKQDSDGQLASAMAVQEKLREQLAQRDAEKAAVVMAKRTAETTVEKLQRQLDTQRAVSGLGSANEVQEQLESLRSIAMCPVCQKNWKDRALTTCGHTMCYDCVQSRLAARMRKCPMCNGHFASNDVLTIHL